MPIVPISRQPKRQPPPQAIPDSKFLLMAMAMMHGEGKFQAPTAGEAAQPSQPNPMIPPMPGV